MITGLKIGNFKAFSDTQYIPIRPITLIFGPNSSGKSSLIHSLILAHHAMEKGELDVNRTIIGGESVDLGGFKQYIYHRDTSRQVEWAFQLDSTKFIGRMAELLSNSKEITVTVSAGLEFAEDVPDNPELLETSIDEFINGIEQAKLSKEAVPEGTISIVESLKKYRYKGLKFKDIYSRKIQTKAYGIDVDGVPFLKMTARQAGMLRLEFINNDHPTIKNIIKAILEASTTVSQLKEDDFRAAEGIISELVPRITYAITSVFFPNVLRIDDQFPGKETNILLPISKFEREGDIVSAFTLIFPRILNELIEGLNEHVKKQIDRLRYLGPLRSYPPRHLAFAEEHNANWLAGGGFAWDEVRKDSVLRKKINEWLGDNNRLQTSYELIVRHLLTIDDLEEPYSTVVNTIEDEFTDNTFGEVNEEGNFVSGDLFGELYHVLHNLKSREKELSNTVELVMKDKRTDTLVSHRDIGIGVSQVLPVLVSAYGNKECIVAIEQPEIHLHPALQAELGDVFIESALGENKNTFIIETHSEHLILRLLRRIRETASGEVEAGAHPIKPEDIAVIYAQPTPQGTKLIELRVTEDGDFVDKWPDGFFAERAKELF